MRDLKKFLSTGCVFLCLGGWVCDGQARGADAPARSKDAAIDAAVAAAAAPGSMSETTPTTNPAVVPTPTTAPATTAPAVDGEKPADAPSTNLNSAVVNVGVDGMVEQFNAQDLDINTALHFLSLQSKRNIIASKDVKGTVTANLYNVTFTEALDSLLKPNGFDYIEKGNFIYVYTTKELEESAEARPEDGQSHFPVALCERDGCFSVDQADVVDGRGPGNDAGGALGTDDRGNGHGRDELHDGRYAGHQ